MIKSTGLAVICDEKILLVKQKGSSSNRYLSIPKGLIHKQEPIVDAAIRETYEETGLLVRREDIEFDSPHIIQYYDGTKIYKQIIYYIARISEISVLQPKDLKEIEWASFISIEVARRYLFIQQLVVLSALNYLYVLEEEMEWLLLNDFIKKEKHPLTDLYIYNYTEKCKKLEYWNETTLRCRGLVLDGNYRIIATPMKKFFEYHQLYQEFFPNPDCKFEIYEKLDGALGILYWTNNLPFITTRASFISDQAYTATHILYNQYSHLIQRLNTDISYYFEIIYPEKRYVVDYGQTTDIILLGAYNNKTKQDIPLRELSALGFKCPNKINFKFSIDELFLMNEKNKEGFVLKYENGLRIKIKFDWYKLEYNKRFLSL